MDTNDIKKTENFKKAVGEAQEAFWAKIVDHYPEVRTGDFPPDATFEFDDACENALARWLQMNHPEYNKD